MLPSEGPLPSLQGLKYGPLGVLGREGGVKVVPFKGPYHGIMELPSDAVSRGSGV